MEINSPLSGESWGVSIVAPLVPVFDGFYDYDGNDKRIGVCSAVCSSPRAGICSSQCASEHRRRGRGKRSDELR